MTVSSPAIPARPAARGDQHAWDVQAFVKADPDPQGDHQGGRRTRLAQIVAACDKLDGLEDGSTENLAACQKAFSFDTLAAPP